MHEKPKFLGFMWRQKMAKRSQEWMGFHGCSEREEDQPRKPYHQLSQPKKRPLVDSDRENLLGVY